MSLSPFHYTLTVTLHFGLHLPSSTAPIALPPVANQAHYKDPRTFPLQLSDLVCFLVFDSAACPDLSACLLDSEYRSLPRPFTPVIWITTLIAPVKDQDPAAIAQLSSVLSAQANQLALHQQQLERLTSLTGELVKALQTLTPTPPASAVTPSPVSPPPPQPATVSFRLVFPDKFDGSPSKCKGFLLQCSIFVNQQPALYPTDASKISFVCSLLTGKALDWATAVWGTNGSVFPTFDYFLQRFREVSDHPSGGKNAGEQLLALSQGSSTAAEFALNFRTLGCSAQTTWRSRNTAYSSISACIAEKQDTSELHAPFDPAHLKTKHHLTLTPSNSHLAVEVLDDRPLGKGRVTALTEGLKMQDYPGYDNTSHTSPGRRMRSGNEVLTATINAFLLTHIYLPSDCAIELLPGTTPPKGRIFPLSQPEAMKKYIEKELSKGFIRPSTSPAAAGFFFVKKKDGTLRPCIDYRGLNDITVKFRYPLPLVPAALEQLRQVKYFTKLDLRAAYNLIRIREGNEWKTAFSTSSGHYEYCIMPFGLANSPSVFQSFINDVFRDILDRWVVVYIDDILIYSGSLQEHILHVRAVLQRLIKHQLYAKAEKYEFHQMSISFLGYIISHKGVSMDEAKVRAVTEWPQPQTLKEL
ncbi:Transposon Tf2-6 polyprotein [Labeo rohita]|uniref:ribonuclease H n=1 Tax=Labeo rohita TaxID=84645 RepID=A0ABQ8L8U1_LABRO|nr:Transposon Tf2-6 polyprotein [Labeo rohita]